MKTHKKSKKSERLHVTYNRKEFLAPNSIRSMAAIFTKIYKDGIGIIRISDCNRTIKIWNNLNNKEEVAEMLQKIDAVIENLTAFREQVTIKNQSII